MNRIPVKNFFIFIVILLLSCSYKKLVRISPDFESSLNNIDTITVISDALVAIDAKNDYYSADASLFLNSIILNSITNNLSLKGYKTKPFKPTLMGAFIDTITNLPLKNIDTNQIVMSKLPYAFKNVMSENQLKALQNTTRRIYLSLIFSNQKSINILHVDNSLRNDLDTISKLINGNYALFVLHQTAIVHPFMSSGLPLLTAASSLAASSGSFLLLVWKQNISLSYLAFVDLSSGKILWSNFNKQQISSSSLFQVAKNNKANVDQYAEIDTNFRWSRWALKNFPKKISYNYFKSNSKLLKYPTQSLFLTSQYTPNDQLPNMYSPYKKLNTKYEEVIDSLILNLSIYEKSIKWEDSNDSLEGRINFYLDDMKSELDSLKTYFKYANHCRSRFKPMIEGKIKLSFTIAKNGKSRNIKIVESTLNDEVLEYVIPYILKMYKFSYGNYKPEKIYTHEISFTKPKWYLF